MRLALKNIRTNGGCQPRQDLDPDTVAEYSEALLDGAEFPSAVVFYDGTDHWLADGYHRHAAHERNGYLDMAVEVRQGTLRDAILYSVGANAHHGLRRTNEDKQRAVDRLLYDDEWSAWSNREISKRCQVDEWMVRQRRKLREEAAGIPQPVERRYVDSRTGRETVMNTAAIGQRPTRVSPTAQAGEPPRLPTPPLAGPEPSEASNVVAMPRRKRGEPEEAEPWSEPVVTQIKVVQALRELANGPPARETIQAFVEAGGEWPSVESVERASNWLGSFLSLYRQVEPMQIRRRAKANANYAGHSNYEELGKKVCPCDICTEWRTRKALKEKLEALVVDHGRSCFCKDCHEMRQATMRFQAQDERRNLWCSMAHQAQQYSWGEQLMAWTRERIAERSDGWWSGRGPYHSIGWWYDRFAASVKDAPPTAAIAVSGSV